MRNTYLLGFTVATLQFILIAYLVFRCERTPQPRLAIDCEYYLEVSEDSIWIESQEGRVYAGVYADLDSLICEDNR